MDEYPKILKTAFGPLPPPPPALVSGKYVANISGYSKLTVFNPKHLQQFFWIGNDRTDKEPGIITYRSDQGPITNGYDRI